MALAPARPRRRPPRRAAPDAPHGAAPRAGSARRSTGQRPPSRSGLVASGRPSRPWRCASGALDARSDVLRRPPPRRPRAPVETHAYVVTLNTGTQRRPRAGRADRDRPRGGLVDLRAARRAARHARRRRRAAPLRLERVLVRAVPVGAAPARRAPLPARPGPALLEHPRRRHQGRRGAEARQDDRRRRDRVQDRLLAPAHDPLRPRRDLRLARSATPRATARAASSCSTTTTSRSRGRGRTTAGRRSWPTTSGGTSTTARSSRPSGARRTWSRTAWSASCCWATSTATSCTCGTWTSASTRRRSTSGRSTRWCSSCARRTTRRKAYGFVGVVTSTADLSASVWLWERAEDGTVSVEKVISIPAEPAEADQLPPILQPFGAVPPLVTDISLSVDDQDLYVSCWGTGELKRFDVSDPRSAARDRLRAARRDRRSAPRTRRPGRSTAGRRWSRPRATASAIFLTNSLYAAWDAQFYPRRASTAGSSSSTPATDGSLTVDPDVFVPFSGERPHQVRLSRRRRLVATPTASRTSSAATLWPYILLGLLGAYHGLNPAMGWLFAVALGMQERSRRAVLRSLRADRDRARALDRAGGGARGRPRAAGRHARRCTSAPASR